MGLGGGYSCGDLLFITKMERERKDFSTEEIILRGMKEEDIPGVVALQHENNTDNVPVEKRSSEGCLGWKVTAEEMREKVIWECSIVIERIKKGVSEILGFVVATDWKAGAVERNLPIETMEKEILRRIREVSSKVRDDINLAIGQVCVSDELRGQGWGRKMYDFEKKMLQKVYEFLILSVKEGNDASYQFHTKMDLPVLVTEKNEEGEDIRHLFGLEFPSTVIDMESFVGEMGLQQTA